MSGKITIEARAPSMKRSIIFSEVRESSVFIARHPIAIISRNLTKPDSHNDHSCSCKLKPKPKPRRRRKAKKIARKVICVVVKPCCPPCRKKKRRKHRRLRIRKRVIRVKKTIREPGIVGPQRPRRSPGARATFADPRRGDPGPPGPPGMRGAPGTPGSDGQQGPPGPQGNQGDSGDPGDPGPPGSRGERGAQGDPGDPGDPGERGPRGKEGDPGDPGDSGERGPRGKEGDLGERGPRGKEGDPGDPGDSGERGPRGKEGDLGERGPRGREGPPGPKGDPGARGPEGPRGKDGERGKHGPRGRRGRHEGAFFYSNEEQLIAGALVLGNPGGAVRFEHALFHGNAVAFDAPTRILIRRTGTYLISWEVFPTEDNTAFALFFDPDPDNGNELITGSSYGSVLGNLPYQGQFVTRLLAGGTLTLSRVDTNGVTLLRNAITGYEPTISASLSIYRMG